jgi:hypothetical protein
MASTMWLLGLIKRPNVDKDLVGTYPSRGILQAAVAALH